VLTYRAGNHSPVSEGWHLFMPSSPERINYGISAENVPYAMSWAAKVIREQMGGRIIEWIDAPEQPGRLWVHAWSERRCPVQVKMTCPRGCDLWSAM
jgi:hypothetical protein